MTAEIIITEEQEEQLNCIMQTQGTSLTTQEFIQALFDEALTANFIYNSKCSDYYNSRAIPEEGEEMTTAYYDSEEGNELLLYDPLDPCVDTDEEGRRI